MSHVIEMVKEYIIFVKPYYNHTWNYTNPTNYAILNNLNNMSESIYNKSTESTRNSYETYQNYIDRSLAQYKLDIASLTQNYSDPEEAKNELDLIKMRVENRVNLDFNTSRNEELIRLSLYKEMERVYPESFSYTVPAEKKEQMLGYQRLYKLTPDDVSPQLHENLSRHLNRFNEALESTYLDEAHMKLVLKYEIFSLKSKVELFHRPKGPTSLHEQLKYLTTETYVKLKAIDFSNEVSEDGMVSMRLFTFLDDFLNKYTSVIFIYHRMGDGVSNDHDHVALLRRSTNGDLELTHVDNETEKNLGVLEADLQGVYNTTVIISKTEKVRFKAVKHIFSEGTGEKTKENGNDPIRYLKYVILRDDASIIPTILATRTSIVKDPYEIKLLTPTTKEVFDPLYDGYPIDQLQAIESFVQSFDE
jgi:hypothetical protein